VEGGVSPMNGLSVGHILYLLRQRKYRDIDLDTSQAAR